MERKIKEFSNGTYLSFDTGYFDDWCVYLTNRNGRRYSPKDSDYFTILKQHFTTFTPPRKLMKLVYTRPELSPLDFLRFGP